MKKFMISKFEKKMGQNSSICLGKGSQVCFQLLGVSGIRGFEKVGVCYNCSFNHNHKFIHLLISVLI